MIYSTDADAAQRCASLATVTWDENGISQEVGAVLLYFYFYAFAVWSVEMLHLGREISGKHFYPTHNSGWTLPRRADWMSRVVSVQADGIEVLEVCLLPSDWLLRCCDLTRRRYTSPLLRGSVKCSCSEVFKYAASLNNIAILQRAVLCRSPTESINDIMSFLKFTNGFTMNTTQNSVDNPNFRLCNPPSNRSL